MSKPKIWILVLMVGLVSGLLIGCSQSNPNLLKNYEGLLTDYERLEIGLEVANENLRYLQIESDYYSQRLNGVREEFILKVQELRTEFRFWEERVKEEDLSCLR